MVLLRYVSKLRAAVRGAGTQERYKQAVDDFWRWCRRQGLRRLRAVEADAAVQMYADAVFAALGGKGRSKVVATLCGLLAARPDLRDKLPGTREALRGWARLRPSKSRPPMGRHLAVAVAVALAAKGEWEAGAAVLIAFEGLLRKGEVLGLRREDVAFPEDARLAEGKETVLRFPFAKGGKEQSVLLQPGPAVTLLRLVVAKAGERDRLFTLTDGRLLSVFKTACAELGLSADYVFHSLRHGRCTELFRQGVPIPTIKLLGRWKSTRACETYVQANRGLLLSRAVPPRLGQLAKRMALNPLRWFRWAMQRAAGTE
jgi:integrase